VLQNQYRSWVGMTNTTKEVLGKYADGIYPCLCLFPALIYIQDILQPCMVRTNKLKMIKTAEIKLIRILNA